MDDVPDMSAVAQAFRRLPENDRELLRLVAWEGLDHAAIATVLGTSKGAVRVRLHRARKRLTRLLHATGFDATPVTVNGDR